MATTTTTVRPPGRRARRRAGRARGGRGGPVPARQRLDARTCSWRRTWSLFVAFVLAPVVYGIWISLHDWDFTLPGKPFVGLDNYADLFDSGVGAGPTVLARHAGDRRSSRSSACRCWWSSRWAWRC